MLTEDLVQYAHRQWLTAQPGLNEMGERWQTRLDQLSGPRKWLLELALGTLPGLDVARCSYETLLSYVDHGLFLRENSPFCRDIPEDMFLHYVFYPRINNEEIVDCRPFFCRQLLKDIQNMPALDAAMAVNRWCAGHMTYQSTDDRTIDPLTAYRCGLGRCGEESTFAVAVLRSVGIPARQIYAPWWSHCDDNHAWVEFFANGQWYYFGACEPEPVPNRGWFTSAASRAMAICSRRFFDYTGEGLSHERPLNYRGCCIMDNQTHRYAKTTHLTVHVPGEEALVRILVLNMAALREIAALPTDTAGNAEFQLGFGSCLIEVIQGDRHCWEPVTLTGPVTLTLIPTELTPTEGSWDWDFIAPMADACSTPLTPEQSARRVAELAQAAHSRNARKQIFDTGDALVDARLNQAGENAHLLQDFLNAHGSTGRELLMNLTTKDWRDVSPEVLESFLQNAPELRQLRIGHEPLKPWAAALAERIPAVQSTDPTALWQWLLREFPPADCRVYPELWPDPLSLLSLGVGDSRDRTMLLTAVLRLAGIPAKPDPIDGTPCWEQKDRQLYPGEQAHRFTLDFTNTDDLIYDVSWTLSRWDQSWNRLNLSGQERKLTLPQGLYQLITITRLPNGNQLARFQTFFLSADTQLSLSRRQGTPEQLLARYPIRLPDCVPGLQLRIYLEPGTEPTEHTLNELLDQTSGTLPGDAIHLYIPDASARQNPTLCRVLEKFPEIHLQQTDYTDSSLEYLARNLYLEPGVWPLLVLTDGKLGYYSHCGYAVGAIPLGLELYRYLNPHD